MLFSKRTTPDLPPTPVNGHRDPTPTEPASDQGRRSTFSDRALMIITCAGLVASVLTALMLADGSSWPQSLIVGLGSGGAALLGALTLVGRNGSQ